MLLILLLHQLASELCQRPTVFSRGGKLLCTGRRHNNGLQF